MQFREMNGFILLDKGKLHYTWHGGEDTIEHGALLYAPIGSSHTAVALCDELSFYRINFMLTDLLDGENIYFSDCPKVVLKNVGSAIFDMAEQLRRCTFAKGDKLRANSLMLSLLDDICRQSLLKSTSRISPAVDYLDAHYTENTPMKELADLCFVSEPHFYRLFHAQCGCSPLEYRLKLRIATAKKLLLGNDLTVSEVAVYLGFESVYYFSRIFRKMTGYSPTNYRKNPNQSYQP